MLIWNAAAVAADASASASADANATVPTVSTATAQGPLAAALPSDAELEAAAARIGQIKINSRAIFDLDNPRENNKLFRLADKLHVGTRLSAVRAQLLFKSGDRYSRRILDETARNLRQLSFLREPDIRPIAYHDGVVDIEVTTHDVWTLQPGISFGRSGGTNRTSFKFSDSNFLGLGKSLDAGHSQDVDRTSTYASWSDPNAFGSRWSDALSYANNSDGRSWEADIEYPFYSLETLHNAGGRIGENRDIVSRYRLGHVYDTYAHEWRWDDAHYGWLLSRTKRWSERLLVGLRRDKIDFAPAAARAPLAPLPTDRNLVYPYVRLQVIEDAYATMQNLDQISRTEDLHYGWFLDTGTAWAAPAFGSDRRALVADVNSSYGRQFGRAHLLFLSSRISGRLEYGRLDNGLASMTASYYSATSDQSRLLVRFSADAGRRLDGDDYLELGGDTGLRGYPLRYQAGNQRALFTVEERLYTHWFLWQLVHVGAAAFYDMGRTWGTAPIQSPQLGLLKDLGIGLRLGNARASFANVIHVDLAAPLDGDRSISKLQLLVSTQSSF